MDQHEHLIFVSYASTDRERVAPIADMLERRGFDAWMDFRRIRPGQVWDSEIRRAMDRASIILVFISHNSVNRRGYVQREIKLALTKAEEKVADDIYIIPVVLDEDVNFPDALKDRHYIHVTAEDFEPALVSAIELQLEKLGAAIAKTQEDTEIFWRYHTYREFRDGIPGYEAQVRTISLRSNLYDNIDNINDVIRGEATNTIMPLRKEYINQNPSHFDFGQEKYSRTNTLQLYFEEPVIRGRIVSIPSSLHTYWVGAAHPNHHFNSYCFFLNPVFLIGNLSSIFENEEQGFLSLQNEVRQQLLQVSSDGSEAPPDLPELDEDWVKRGTSSWEDFSCFIFRATGIDICFSPYQVAPYSYGDLHALVDYTKVSQMLKKEFRSALDIPIVYQME